ncbi:MAG: tRNA (uridine(34)/cytosine(34)/5-carboxymethylaminomethyluridine(34)-2'-O)-methyltransferase TrmL [Clostridiales bacterium]|jgi:tRNA (cytidine/uridine-2'-O-)-methyltransferase|nr:tRNA (uridine(34)/cytosine(34)/5-carboxymethylaminomethyluridine(34)-2'-O)-methyltransferase TrmL [Clostridiales bacterium]
MPFNVVLVEPEIPQNTGNIARTCGGCNARLHLVKPLGFSVSDRYLKRAGLDYWHFVDISYYDSFEELKSLHPGDRFWLCTTKGAKNYADVTYTDEDFLVFGKETAGLPEALLRANLEKCIRIPMRPEFRSLNLSNAVAIILYEAVKQQGFPNMENKGKLAYI